MHSGIHPRTIAIPIFLLFAAICAAPASQALQWFGSDWSYVKRILIDNIGGSALVDHQVRIVLGASFDFSLARSGGEDIRITTNDGGTPVSFWIESWDASAEEAVLWAKVPTIPAGESVELFLYYGNPQAASGSDGTSTFALFDDFDSVGQGYWTLSEPEPALVQSETWEVDSNSAPNAPHTLSVIQPAPGLAWYIGYYGLQRRLSRVGIAWSSDLLSWTKLANHLEFVGDPVSNGRWPSVLVANGAPYMVTTKNYLGGNQRLALLKGVGAGLSVFTEFHELKTLAGPPTRNQNPHLFYNVDDQRYYLYWLRKRSNDVLHEIWVRSADDIEALDNDETDTLILSANQILAAPNIMLRDGRYYLAVEALVGSAWQTEVYESSSPSSGFALMAGNPILDSGSACYFQHIFDDVLHGWYCKLTGSEWSVAYRSADLLEPRPTVPGPISPQTWTKNGGFWNQVEDSNPFGELSGIGRGIVDSNVSGAHIASSTSFVGDDYVIEGAGRLLAGSAFRVSVRHQGASAQYSVDVGLGFATLNRSGVELDQAMVGPGALGEWVQFGVAVHGNQIEVYLNDTLVLSALDETPLASGAVALGVGSEVEAQFDDVRVRQHSDVAPAASVGPAIGLDSDEDGVPEWLDNCSQIANPAQEDADEDSFGDYCDCDFNNDGVCNLIDALFLLNDFCFFNPDYDGIIDCTASSHNHTGRATDMNSDGTVDFNDSPFWFQASADGLPGPGPVGSDSDGDGVTDDSDNCIDVPNGPFAATAECGAQEDGDLDGYGSPCDTDVNNNGATDLIDWSQVSQAAAGGSTDPVYDFDCSGSVDSVDSERALSDAQAVAVPGPSGLTCAGNSPCPLP